MPIHCSLLVYFLPWGASAAGLTDGPQGAMKEQPSATGDRAWDLLGAGKRCLNAPASPFQSISKKKTAKPPLVKHEMQARPGAWSAMSRMDKK